MTEILQPKHYHLRLNLEQVQHLTDGLIENQKNIDPAFIGVYDGQMNNVFSQLRDQGIQIEVPEYEVDESKEEEYKRAAIAMKMFRHKIMEYMPESEHKTQVIAAYDDLHSILFGE